MNYTYKLLKVIYKYYIDKFYYFKHNLKKK